MLSEHAFRVLDRNFRVRSSTPKRNPMYWRTKDGQECYIPDMKDSHLTNSIRYLERKFSKEQCETWPVYLNLTQEAMRRNLNYGTDWDE